MTRMLTIVVLAGCVAGCGHKKEMLGKDAFVQAARDCHATGYSYQGSAVKDGAPELTVIDATVQINGQPVDVARCVADKIGAYRYGHLTLQASPAEIRK